jgi:hypothetical protein
MTTFVLLKLSQGTLLLGASSSSSPLPFFHKQVRQHFKVPIERCFDERNHTSNATVN